MLPIIKAGSLTGMSYLKEFLLNNVNLVVFMLIDNLMALNLFFPILSLQYEKDPQYFYENKKNGIIIEHSAI